MWHSKKVSSFSFFLQLELLQGEETSDDAYQRWSRGHKARGQGKDTKKIQGQGQPFRGETLSRPRTEMLEAKAKDQGHKRKCSPKKKKGLHKNFSGDLQKKKGLHKNFSSDLHKKTFSK